MHLSEPTEQSEKGKMILFRLKMSTFCAINKNHSRRPLQTGSIESFEIGNAVHRVSKCDQLYQIL